MIGFEVNTFLHFVDAGSKYPAQLLRCNSDPTISTSKLTTCFSTCCTGNQLHMSNFFDSDDSSRITNRHSLRMQSDRVAAATNCMGSSQPANHTGEESMGRSSGTDGSVPSEHKQARSSCKPARPSKLQRTMFAEFIKEQKSQLAAKLDTFDIESVHIPEKLKRGWKDERSLARLKATLYKFKDTLIHVPDVDAARTQSLSPSPVSPEAEL